MAYITTAKVKEIRDNLKKEFSAPLWKFSVVRDGGNCVVVAIMKVPYNFCPEHSSGVSINHYNPHIHQHANILRQIIAIVNDGNHNNSEIMYDYHDVGWYVSLKQGKWNAPFVYTGKEDN